MARAELRSKEPAETRLQSRHTSTRSSDLRVGDFALNQWPRARSGLEQAMPNPGKNRGMSVPGLSRQESPYGQDRD